MKRVVLAVLLGSLLLVGSAATAAPKKAPSGTGSASARCWASADRVDAGSTYILSAEGLPTDIALNVGVTTNGEETIVPFGMSVTGSEAFQEVATDVGHVTYRFLGPLRGNAKVYASCSLDIV